MLCGDRLREGAVERGDVDEFDLVAHVALGEERVGEEHELERSDRALDRHLDDVHDEASTGPVGQLGGQRRGAFEGVEVVNRRAVLVAVEPFGLIASRVRPGGDHELVVVEAGAVGQRDRRGVGVDDVDFTEDHVDVGGEQGPGVLDDVVGLVGPEGDEEVAGLIVVLAAWLRRP